ncbi:MAG: GntR family transcriptional regulator [Rhizobiaceae bacterium]|nr:GntR family transcriptional regulator [Rhizobiaceae bacterium]
MDISGDGLNGIGASEGGDPGKEIASALEQDIVLGRLAPGEKLREEDLAERFSASRHHVREGLNRLERAGIVIKERNRGVSVRRFTVDEVRQIYEVREILQRQASLMIRLPADAGAIARLVEINDRYENAVEAGDFQRIHETNDLFHTELFRLCGNELLLNLVKNYMDLTYAIRGSAFGHRENLETSRRHHRIMIGLLQGTDSWALAQICVDHIQPTKTQYLAFLEGRPRNGDEGPGPD